MFYFCLKHSTETINVQCQSQSPIVCFTLDTPQVTGTEARPIISARPLPERYALWQERFSLQSVCCKEKAGLLVVCSSVALSLRPALQRYSPAVLISCLLALSPNALRVGKSDIISTTWLDNTLRWGPQCGLQTSNSITYTV